MVNAPRSHRSLITYQNEEAHYTYNISSIRVWADYRVTVLIMSVQIKCGWVKSMTRCIIALPVIIRIAGLINAFNDMETCYVFGS